jgi:deazaflavin-dependent oxidoreductase (nitroreductase family)
LLTTTGRRTGRHVTTPVLVLRDGNDYVVVGSNYGRDRHPAWTYNLIAHAQASLQMGSRHVGVTGERLDKAQVEAYWPRLVQMWPGWKTYRRITDRDFRMFRLTPSSVDQRPDSTSSEPT